MRTTSKASKRPTMRDVAALAGVSVQTVSNHVNGRHQFMADATRARVAQAMDELGYHPNLTARGLRSAETKTLGLLVLDEHPRFLADPLTDLIIAGVGDVAREREYGILIQASKPSDGPERLLTPLLASRVDGVFLLLSGDPAIRRDVISRVAELTDKFVVFDEPLEDPGAISIRAADRTGAKELVAHLLDRGHERIAFISAAAPWAVVEERYKGFVEALADRGLEPDPDLVRREAGWEPASAVPVAEALLRRREPPTAIIGASDLLALAAMHTAQRLGFDVPGDVAIAGFDDFPFSAFANPALTTVSIPAYEMGVKASSILIDRLGGGDGGASAIGDGTHGLGGREDGDRTTGAETELELPVELLVRDST